MKAKDLMRKDVFTIQAEQSVDALIEMLIREHIHGAPVVEKDGTLAGVVTQQDVFFSSWTLSGDSAERARKGRLKVRDIMTCPAVTTSPETDLRGVCRLMSRLRVHRVPVIEDDKVVGVISSLDVCAAVAQGELTT